MKIKNITISAIVLVLLLLSGTSVFAGVPYHTYTRGLNNRAVRTQTVFEPLDVINLPINEAEDIFYDRQTGILYVADTGNSRILLVKNDEVLSSLGEGVLDRPTGLFLDDQGKLYVADQGKSSVIVFNPQGEVVNEFGRPTEPLFGRDNDFVPMKLAVDKRGNIYVVSEGSVDGVVQLSHRGSFLGYIGSNRTELTFRMLLRRLVFTEEQREQLFKKVPPSPTNITVGADGLVYTVTEGLTSQAIKRLNIAGTNIFPDKTISTNAMTDIAIDEKGNIFALDRQGYILVYDSFGNLLFMFGGRDTVYERLGLLRNPVAIDINDSGYLYVLDKERSVINVYRPTEFFRHVMEGVDLYKQGLYTEGHAVWNDILRMNSSFILAHRAIAKSYFRQGNYEQALASFRLAEDKQSYSDAYWQIRNFWIQRNMSYVLLFILIFILIRLILRMCDKKFGIYNYPKDIYKRFSAMKLIRELRFALRFFKHPLDAFYDLKVSKSASVLSASLLYLWLLIIEISRIYITGFSFSTVNPEDVNLMQVVLTTFVPLALFVGSNHLVSTISDGEGTFKDVYIATIYSLTPYLVLAMPAFIISNILTLNEVFLFNFTLIIAGGWSLMLLCIMIKEIHNYTFKETMRNIGVTIFGAVVIVIVVFILFILSRQVVDFVGSIIEEVSIRA